jgi:putative hydrolase of the HAD superfamily
MKPRAIIFDLFGTLTDAFAASLGSRSADFAMALGVPYEPFMRMWRQTLEARTLGEFQSVESSIEYVSEAIGARVSVKKMTEAVAIRLEQINSMLQPRPDAIATIRQLKTRGYKIGLLSNCSIEIPILWPKTPLAELFDCAVFSSRERLKKPDPRIYHLISNRLQVTPKECLYIADGENYELAAATGVGMRPILLRSPSRDNDKEILREAREWQGEVINALSELLTRL